MSEIRITIGITCYREGDLLRECWESVLAQTDDRWFAALVMDGGADEKTREVFASIEHPRLLKKYTLERNQGCYPVKNKAFELTTTAFHFYLDADDMLPPGCIAAMYRTLEAHPDADHVYGDHRLIPSMHLVTVPREIRSPFDIFSVGAAWGLHRVETWRALGGFPDHGNNFAADTDLKISMYEAGAHMYHCGDINYLYRAGRAGSVTSIAYRHAADSALIIIGRHPAFFRDHATRERMLQISFDMSIPANLAAGNRLAALKCVWSAIRNLGVFHRRVFGYMVLVVLGERALSRIRGLARRPHIVSG
jgi:glycosyltransferase involved in cell wall biosynthesis